jgi:HEAT repeat protein
MKKYGCILGIAALILGVVVLVAGALLIYSLRDTSLRYTIDGLVVDSPKWELRAAVASGDDGNILRAFTKATYRPEWKMSDAIPTMQSYLTNPNPVVRCYAAKALYTFGDQTGYKTMLDLVNANGPMIHFEHDLRIDAIETLSKYRQKDAAQSILALYDKTDDSQLTGRELRGSVVEGLILMAPDLARTLTTADFYNEPTSITDYGLLDDQQFLPQITASFQTSQKTDVKMAAAWALATMKGDPGAIDYLAQTAESMLGQAHTPFEMREMVKYLGTIQDPRMKPLLEKALDSDDPAVVGCAIVNLLYNQGGSDKAKSVLAEALNLKRMNLPWDFVWQVAAQFKDDPKIKEAGEHFAQTDVTESWQLWTGDRQNWSIYNWIDGCVLRLNDKK